MRVGECGRNSPCEADWKKESGMFDDRDYQGAPSDVIAIHGAREHNLKNLSLDIPRNSFVVVTGVSGSGKSTLAFDLLFAEGQRRFLDSMNVYARQFIEQLSHFVGSILDIVYILILCSLVVGFQIFL